MSILSKSLKAIEDGGITTLLQRTFNLVHNKYRHLLPTKIYDIAGVPYKGRLGDFHNTTKYAEDLDYKWQARQMTARYVKETDTCVSVGGGKGITAAHLAENSEYVKVIEPAEQMIDKINETMKLSNHGNYEILPWLMYDNPEEYIWGDLSPNVKTKTGKDIPECDVLELDCEGVEDKIIEDLQINPRVLIVEVHCKFGVDYEETLEKVREKGYKIDFEYQAYFNYNVRHFAAVKDKP